MVEEYAEDAVGLLSLERARQFEVSDLVTAKFSELLKKSMSMLEDQHSTSLLSAVWFLVLIIAERAVKVNCRVVNKRLLIALNGICQLWFQTRTVL